MRNVWIFLVVGVLVVGGFAYHTLYQGNSPDAESAVESYVREHIGELSPESPVLGGAFYVTSIQTNAGAGVVAYEDGHIALVADFTFDVDENGNPRILSFTVRE